MVVVVVGGPRKTPAQARGEMMGSCSRPPQCKAGTRVELGSAS